MAIKDADRKGLTQAAKTDPLAALALADLYEERGEAGPGAKRYRLFAEWYPLIQESVVKPVVRTGRRVDRRRVVTLGHAHLILTFCRVIVRARLFVGYDPAAGWERPLTKVRFIELSRGLVARPDYLPRRVWELVDAYLAHPLTKETK